MEQLCYETLEKAGYTGYLLKNAPERVLQFGEGNFLRAFADYWFDMANSLRRFLMSMAAITQICVVLLR